MVCASGTQTRLAHGFRLGALRALGRALPRHAAHRTPGNAALRTLLLDSLRQDRDSDPGAGGHPFSARRCLITSLAASMPPSPGGTVAPVTPDSSNRHSLDIQVQHGELICGAFSKP